MADNRGMAGTSRPRKGDPRRLGAIETVAAWLRVWTPPRDAIVAPVPWRALTIGGVLVALVIAAALALAVPPIQSGRRASAEAERRASASALAQQRRRIELEQRARYGQARRPRRPLSAGARRRARESLVAAVEKAITADARGRVRGQARGRPPLVTECRPRSGSDRSATIAVLDCLAVQRRIVQNGQRGAIGIPFRAVVDNDRFTYAWCKTNPPAGERGVPSPERVVPLPSACRA